jgi:gamma-glutamyltranspeptidase/glutathione hydrolase
MTRWLLVLAMGAGLGCATPAGAAAAAGTVAPEQAPPPIAAKHMIVAAEPEAAEAGLEMLRNGGSAVDAAIAAQLVLTLVEPQASGIGGGAYMLVADGNAVQAYDGREKAPASARPTMFLDAKGQPRGFRDVQYGGLTVGVPGTLAMLAMAYKEHGRLDWARLFEPAIALAGSGFMVSDRLARELAEDAPRLAAMPDMRAYFFHPDGTPLRKGEMLRNPDYAETLSQIAQAGPDALYKGALAAKIADAVSKAPVNPTPMTPADLAAYAPKAYAAVCGTYRMYKVCGMPPSSSGGVTTLEILGLLQRFSSAELKPGSLSSVYLMSEASKLAYADRLRWLGDPDFVTAPTGGLLDPGYLAARSRLIDPAHAMGVAVAGMPPMRSGELLYGPQRPQAEYGTSHLSVVDDYGEVISMTTSIQAAFGSALMADGFVLNNELTDFSFEPMADGLPVANAAAPGKRPLCSMSPTIIFAPDGSVFASLGSPGGRQIIAYVAQAVSNLIDGQLSMQGAAAEPRHVNMNGPTFLEKGTALDKLAPQLAALGEQVRMVDFDSGVNGIRHVPNGYEGGADPRREGVALGD